MQEILWSIYNIENTAVRDDVIFDDAFPFLEFNCYGVDSLKIIRSQTPPRLIKTHLQVKFYKRQLEGKSPCPKFVFVYRNPKATLYSYFHHHKFFQPPYKYPGTWNQFFDELVKTRRILYGDYFEYLLGWWRYRNHDNVFLVKYEDLLVDPKMHVRNLTKFLGRSLTDEQLDHVIDQSSFPKMKARGLEKYSPGLFSAHDPNISRFFRSGTKDSWQEALTEEQIKWLDERIVAELEPVGLNFK